MNLVHPSSPEDDPEDREPWYVDAPVRQARGRLVFDDADPTGHPTCKGPGPTRHEFVNDAGHRDVVTVEQCPRCDGHGGSHGGYTLVTLEQQEKAS